MTYSRGYYVSSPAKDGRQKKNWVCQNNAGELALADWSYGMTFYPTLEEAELKGAQAQAQWPNRIFRIDKDVNNIYVERVKYIGKAADKPTDWVAVPNVLTF